MVPSLHFGKSTPHLPSCLGHTCTPTFLRLAGPEGGHPQRSTPVDYSWHVDTILNLIRIAGDYVSEEVWYRVLQIATNRDDVQGYYAAKTVFEVTPCPTL